MNTEQKINDDGFTPASYKIRVNGKDHTLATPEPSVQAVIELTGKEVAGHMLIEMAKGQEKRTLTLDADIDLRIAGIEEFIVVSTKPEYIIYIDGTQVIFYTPNTNGLELLQKVGKKPGDFALAQLIPGAENEFIEPDEKVNLAFPGIEKFVTVVLDEITIIVNARPKPVKVRSLSFADIVVLAFGAQAGAGTAYTISYRKGPRKNPEGTLVEGQTVKIKEGMVFNVSATNQS